MSLKVTPAQFKLENRKLTHVPSGAQFWMGAMEIVIAGWDDARRAWSRTSGFDPTEVKRVACEILELEQANCV